MEYSSVQPLDGEMFVATSVDSGLCCLKFLKLSHSNVLGISWDHWLELVSYTKYVSVGKSQTQGVIWAFPKGRTQETSKYTGRQRVQHLSGKEFIGLIWMWVKMEDLGDHRC